MSLLAASLTTITLTVLVPTYFITSSLLSTLRTRHCHIEGNRKHAKFRVVNTVAIVTTISMKTLPGNRALGIERVMRQDNCKSAKCFSVPVVVGVCCSGFCAYVTLLLQ